MSKKSKKSKRNPRTQSHSVPAKRCAKITATSTFIISLAIIVICFAAAFLYEYRLSLAKRDSIVNTLNSISNHDFGDTYDDYIADLLADPPDVEIIAVFDQDGRKLIEYAGLEYGVSLPKEALELLQNFQHLKHVHNHPSNGGANLVTTDYRIQNLDAGANAVFNVNDLTMPYRTGLKNCIDSMVVVSGNGTYTLDRNGHDWPTYDDMDGICYAIYYSNLTSSPPNSSIEQVLSDSGYFLPVTSHGYQVYAATLQFSMYVAEAMDYDLYVKTF